MTSQAPQIQMNNVTKEDTTNQKKERRINTLSIQK